MARRYLLDQVVLLHDPITSTVHRSPDEGATWSKVPSVPEGQASRLVAHPHNNEMAFILGKSTTHWVTYNRGDSWLSFETPREASLTGEVLSFHAVKTGMDSRVCECSSLTTRRLDLVSGSRMREYWDREMGKRTDMLGRNVLHYRRFPFTATTVTQANLKVPLCTFVPNLYERTGISHLLYRV